MQEFGNDGRYLDGMSNMAYCTNLRHDCGDMAPDETIHPTADIFAVRDFMNQFYAMTPQRGSQTKINVHQLTCMVTI